MIASDLDAGATAANDSIVGVDRHRSRSPASVVDAGPGRDARAIPPASTGLVHLELGVGFSSASVEVPQPELNAWFDDLVVSTSPIACTD
jgi:hypothetical protein